MMQFFSNTFKGNIAQVPAVIDDTLLKPFTEVFHGFAGHHGWNGGDFLSYCLLELFNSSRAMCTSPWNYYYYYYYYYLQFISLTVLS